MTTEWCWSTGKAAIYPRPKIWFERARLVLFTSMEMEGHFHRLSPDIGRPLLFTSMEEQGISIALPLREAVISIHKSVRRARALPWSNIDRGRPLLFTSMGRAGRFINPVVREAGNFYSQHGRGRALPLIKL
jgi:hypothetical protein